MVSPRIQCPTENYMLKAFFSLFIASKSITIVAAFSFLRLVVPKGAESDLYGHLSVQPLQVSVPKRVTWGPEPVARTPVSRL